MMMVILISDKTQGVWFFKIKQNYMISEQWENGSLEIVKSSGKYDFWD